MGFFGKKKKVSDEAVSQRVTGKVEFLIVGLGNPGVVYEETRHNAGYIAIDMLCEKLGVECKRAKFDSMYCEAMISGKRCVIIKPVTYMNNSGMAVYKWADFYKLPPEKVLVIFDDISLDVSRLRVRRKGSAGGHNGIKSIIEMLGSQDIPRIKLGVGQKPSPEYDLADWVLSRFSGQELEKLREAAKKACEAAELIVSDNIDKAMDLYNS